MKQILLLFMVVMLSSATAAAVSAPKESNDTTIILTVEPQMHCVNCEKKIKSNIRFEKGVKSITTDRTKQTVTIRADKTKLNIENLHKAFAKIGYRVK